MPQTAVRQAAERIEEPVRDCESNKELAAIHASLEKIARTLEHIYSAVEKEAESNPVGRTGRGR